MPFSLSHYLLRCLRYAADADAEMMLSLLRHAYFYAMPLFSIYLFRADAMMLALLMPLCRHTHKRHTTLPPLLPHIL